MIRILQTLLFVRVIISWFPNFQGGAIMEFLYYFTEPILAPIRRFLMRIRQLQQLPVDLSVLVAYLLLEIIAHLLY